MFSFVKKSKKLLLLFSSNMSEFYEFEPNFIFLKTRLSYEDSDLLDLPHEWIFFLVYIK